MTENPSTASLKTEKSRLRTQGREREDLERVPQGAQHLLYQKREFFGELKKSHKAGREKKQELTKRPKPSPRPRTRPGKNPPAGNRPAAGMETAGPVEGWGREQALGKSSGSQTSSSKPGAAILGSATPEQLANLQKKKEPDRVIEAFTPTGNTNEDL